MKTIRFFLTLSALLAITGQASSEVFKCIGTNGVVSFSDRQCQDATPAQKNSASPAPTPVEKSPAVTQARERKAMIDKWESEIEAAKVKRRQELAAPPPKSTQQQGDQRPVTESTPMEFDLCRKTVVSTILGLGVPWQDVKWIVRTDVLTMTRLCTADGSVLITCSKPDAKMVTVKSSDNDGTGCR